jgi:N-acetylmuramoyl-L-alanine amidase
LTKIYLDAGHGGTDSGATGNGILEKNINLAIAKKIGALLEANYENVEIEQTRTTDVFLSLDERTDKANKWGADCFVAVHINSATTPTARGFESFIYNVSPSARTISFQNIMHESIWNQIKSTVGVIDRGKNRANFHVLRESSMIAILVENFFISNSQDASLLKSDSFLDKLSQGYVDGLERFFGLKKKVSPTPPPTTETLYQVVAGTYSNKSNAEAQVKKLASDGYSAYIIEKE